MAKAVMIQGTGSDVGKSLLCAGLCRALTQAGYRVRPFKPQNMSNNAAVTVDGGEIGRAQAVQARACGVAPSIHMNPVLLKPETDRAAQLIVHGKRVNSMQAGDYLARRGHLLDAVLHSFACLRAQADIVVVEGAGSASEVNLRAGDIANMGFARAAHVPVLLVGDIHRGGVIASLVGTRHVLAPQDAAMIKGFLVNRFRGDPRLFDDGVTIVETRTGWPCLGVVPDMPAARDLPAEDAVALEHGEAAGVGRLHVAVPVLSRIANFDDLDPLRLHDGVRLSMVRAGSALPGDADLIVLPGSKATIADLAFLRAQGWDIDIAAHIRRGGRVLGVCGGYQMLGRAVHDPDAIEGPAGSVAGLGLLDVETVLHTDKQLTNVQALHVASGAAMTCYEIHIGRTRGPDCARPFAQVAGKADGARSADGRIEGTYLHGLFSADTFRTSYLRAIDPAMGMGQGYDARVEAALDTLADGLRRHVDLDALLTIAGKAMAPVSG